MIDMTGQRFGRLIVLRRNAENTPDGEARWDCACDCGEITTARGKKLRQGRTKSCGCLRREVSARSEHLIQPTHGWYGTPTYKTWNMAVQRCTNPKATGYANYGGRGITMCDRWRYSFPNFLADMGQRPAGLTLDRVDNDGPYAPGNCRWATPAQQAQNRRGTDADR